ncbi:acyltransferase [Paenibacillus sp. YPG26]|uniref:acyltransferase n=1 Tax=Paenibacillus sp. YPG26 TaxID=2878915 RepID=UPI00203D755C|nr:acyltransferase [Paenibacillus sp. YPG26]USB34984.1 acyltransferase [Paenibacillus sp. YPG26]
MTQIVKKERILEIELLRGFAFAGVVFQHAVAHYGYLKETGLADGALLALLVILSKFAVPVFIFITGMVLFYNYDGQLNYRSFLGKRIKDIGAPFLAWSVFYMWLNHALPGAGLHELLAAGERLITGKSSFHLWYVFMIVQFYLLFPLFRRGLRRLTDSLCPSVRPWAVFAAGAAYIGLMPLIGMIAGLFRAADIPVLTPLFTTYADRNVLYYLFYFLLGAAAGMNVARWQLWVRQGRYFYWPVFLGFTAYFFYQLVDGFQQEDGLHIHFNGIALLQPLMVIFLTSSIFVLYRIAMALKSSGSPLLLRMLTRISMLSYGAYLMHAGVLRIAYTLEGSLIAEWSTTVRTIIAFLLCMGMCCLFTWLLARLPFGKWLVGVHIPRKAKIRHPTDQKAGMTS